MVLECRRLQKIRLRDLHRIKNVPLVRKCSIICAVVGVWASTYIFIGFQGPHFRQEERALGQQVHVFSSGEAGVPCFRIPAVVRTASGTLVAFAEARHGRILPRILRLPWYSHGCEDAAVHEIATKRSADGGRTWSPVAFAAGSAEQHVGNPWPIATRSGRLLLVYVKHGHGCTGDCGSEMVGNGVVVSDDDGATWSEERDVSEQFGPARGCMPGPGAGVELDSGRLLVVSHCGTYRMDYVTYSDDGGRSWATVPRPFLHMDEATVADLGGGKVVVNMRHRQEHRRGRAVARSADGGLTWSDVTWDPVLVGPVCQGSAAAIGGRLYFSNPASARGRYDLTLRRSVDGGLSWTAMARVQPSTTTYGYSSIVQGVVDPASNMSGILYESNAAGTPSKISFQLFPLDF